ncbi:MAG TPA: thiamine pyrophosphate-binding protein [Candidatus Lokiarchaeia archaeon]|nr:thiamine pyrophosphate-binding protein [Candidatus Lokiarchaeia archaeon]
MADGGDEIARILKYLGVECLFTVCGGHIAPILVGAKRHDIRVVDVRQEATAIFAADATARLTGIPSVAVVTAGPGVTNAVTAIKNAQMAQSPVILLGGAVATALRGRGALQDIDQLGLYRTIVKWTTRISTTCDFSAVLNEAFTVARSGIPGPVFVECPVDTLYDEKIVRQWYGAELDKTPPKSVAGKAINWYLRRHVDTLFACDASIEDAPAGPVDLNAGIDRKIIPRVRHAIDQASKPVLLVGSQAMLDPVNDLALAAAVRELGLPVYLAGMARGLLGKEDPIDFRHHRSKALHDADVVILAGMPLDFRLDYGRSINHHATIIAIRRAPERTERNRRPDIRVQADPASFLIALSKVPRVKGISLDAWFARLQEHELEREREIQAFAEIEGTFINPVMLCKEIDAAMADDSIIIGDGGDFVATASYIVRPRAPHAWLDPGPYGTLGVGAGFALAAKLVHPSSEVWLLYGDGAAGYGLIEFDTYVRHQVPVIAVIGNDAGWTQIWRDQVEYLGDDVGTLLRHSDYNGCADALGAKGLKVDSPSKLKEALVEAKALVASRTPVLVNVLMDRTEFRKGSTSM